MNALFLRKENVSEAMGCVVSLKKVILFYATLSLPFFG
jgi:hypothetical protein